jgi:hypothetical protein
MRFVHISMGLFVFLLKDEVIAKGGRNENEE